MGGQQHELFLRAAAMVPESAIGRIQVASRPDRPLHPTAVPLSFIYDEAYMDREFRGLYKARVEWRRFAVRYALDRYIEAIDASTDSAVANGFILPEDGELIKAQARDAVVSPRLSDMISVSPVRALGNNAMEDFRSAQIEQMERLRRGEVDRAGVQAAIEHFWVGRLRRAVIQGDVENGSVMAGEADEPTGSEQHGSAGRRRLLRVERHRGRVGCRDGDPHQGRRDRGGHAAGGPSEENRRGFPRRQAEGGGRC